VLASSFEALAGGKGANQAAAAARLGADSFGDRLRRELGLSGVDIEGIRIEPAYHTGVAQVVVDAVGRNQIALAPGANEALRVSDVESNAGWNGASLVLLQLEVPLAVNIAALRFAAQRHLPTILNAAPAPPLAENVFENLTWLIANEGEAKQLAGRDVSRCRRRMPRRCTTRSQWIWSHRHFRRSGSGDGVRWKIVSHARACGACRRHGGCGRCLRRRLRGDDLEWR